MIKKSKKPSNIKIKCWWTLDTSLTNSKNHRKRGRESQISFGDHFLTCTWQTLVLEESERNHSNTVSLPQLCFCFLEKYLFLFYLHECFAYEYRCVPHEYLIPGKITASDSLEMVGISYPRKQKACTMSAKGIEEDTETLNTSYANRLAELILQK